MKPVKTIYPALGRYFKTTTDLANAACMGRVKAFKCLSGETDFTPQEKKAIAASIIVRMERGEIEVQSGAELLRMYEAYDNFDKVFRIGA